MKIIIATGIFPPQIGGPALYAYNLRREFSKLSHDVEVVTYGKPERLLPFGLRHIYFFFRLLTRGMGADAVLSLDPLSVGLPAAVFSKIFNKKHIIRFGGDFLWESYVERTRESITLSKFYSVNKNLSWKERTVFRIIKWVLENSTVVTNSEWFGEIISKAYQIPLEKILTVENFYGKRIPSNETKDKIFICATRPLYLKNIDRLKRAFAEAQKMVPGIILDTRTSSHEELMERIKNCYAVILPSISEVNPNLIYDSIRCGKPFIVSREVGAPHKIMDLGLQVNPLDERDMCATILELCDEKKYQEISRKIAGFKFEREWSDVAKDFIKIISHE
jgi:glycosyltransferase involved in cell wall biosynthesis